MGEKKTGIYLNVTKEDRNFLSKLCELEARTYCAQVMWMARKRLEELGHPPSAE